MLQNAPPLWAGILRQVQRSQKSDRPDILVRQLHFRRDWKVSAIREAPPCACLPVGRGGELHLNQ